MKEYKKIIPVNFMGADVDLDVTIIYFSEILNGDETIGRHEYFLFPKVVMKGSDVSDWFDGGESKKFLIKLVREALKDEL